jgi:3-phenylpropionate/cinnamic acid dioxygenase small subunit
MANLINKRTSKTSKKRALYLVNKQDAELTARVIELHATMAGRTDNCNSIKKTTVVNYEVLKKDYKALSERVDYLEKVVAFLVKENKINILEII